MPSNTVAGSQRSSQSHATDSETGSALAVLTPPPPVHPDSRPIIAVDLDDVLSQTNAYIAQWHNDKYGSKMTLDDFHYYHYWKNPCWGTPDETNEKVKNFYSGSAILDVQLVPGALEGVTKLRDMGYRLVIVTARMRNQLDHSWQWLEKHFSGIFESVICIGQFEESVQGEGHEIVTKLTKVEVCRSLPATLLIDDSIDNALSVSAPAPPPPSLSEAMATPHPQKPRTHKAIPVLLFGTYPWNARSSSTSSPRDYLSFDQRTEQEGKREWWRDEDVDLDEINEQREREGGGKIWRVNNWEAAVRWVEKNRP